MLRAWLPSSIVGPLALVAVVSSCGVGVSHDQGLGPDNGSGAQGSGATSGSSSSEPNGGSSGTVAIVMLEGGTVDPCTAAGLPEGCMTAPAPACGDGMLNQTSEQCDDGNTLPGDCCSGTCQIEPNCSCDANGANCHSIFVCGDGTRDPGEACDDGNTTSGDGCSADCHAIEPGYSCPTPGQPCVHHYVCGDGTLDPNEGCDDGNNTDGDGCSAHCRIEQGYKCDGSPSVCTPTVCGDGKKEGAESCDDGNTIPFDGCSPTCQAEPTCPTGMPCTSTCGDGIVLGDEECDDGNVRDGDGCSSTCQIEAGYTCSNDGPCTTQSGVDPTTGMTEDICILDVPTIFRDFNSSKVTGGHPDFQPGFNSAGAVQGLVEDMLDADGKPVERADLSATALNNAYLHGQADFAEWYRDGAPSSGPIPGNIVLWDNGKGGYVNRWGAHGEQWQGQLTSQDYGTPTAGLAAGMGCSSPDYPNQGCTPGPGQVCYDPCVPWNSTAQACCGDVPAPKVYDGNPLFFPIDTAKGILTEPRSEGEVPAQYGWVGWPWEHIVAPLYNPPVTTPIQTSTALFPSTMHNFSFTTEVKYWFKYTNALQATLDFTGDDDLWVFLNGHLAVDMGGWHVPLDGTLTINGATIDATAQTNADDTGVGPTTNNPGTAADYGLTDGNVYQVQIFNAEREVQGSTFKLTLGGFNLQPSLCLTDCGDGMIEGTEECDDGSNKGGYNECAPGCVLGPRCGDGVVQTEDGEVCDDGVNAGTYGGCGPDCQPGPRCGDGIVQTQDGEVCDDGVNAGAYGGCGANCQPGPHCGDGVIDVPYEECDDGNDVSGDGCSNCKIDVPVTK
jgi:fibro-slime domain-containing protein